jgi:hypothetical protein
MALVQRAISFAARNQLLLLRAHTSPIIITDLALTGERCLRQAALRNWINIAPSKSAMPRLACAYAFQL